MTAIRLLIALAIKFALGVLVFRGAGLSTALSLLCAPLFILALDAAVICLTFAMSWPRAGERGSAKGLGWMIKTVGAECLAYSALFSVIQPFEAFFIGKRSASLENAPVLLVPGYLCNRSLWWWLRKGLREAGIAAEPVNLEPPLAGIGELADALHEAIEARLKNSESGKLVLVTHSMGGLVARSYLARRGAGRVSKLITLACPHHGTRLAALGFGDNAREMEPESHWLAQLTASETASVPVTNIWSTQDNFITPQTSSRLKGARELVLPGPGHMSFLFSRRVLELLRRELV